MAGTTSSNDLPIEIIEEKTLFHGRWLGAKQIIYRHKTPGCSPAKHSELPLWQVAYRTTKPATATVDGVSVIATVTKRNTEKKPEKFLLLVKQFRIPLMKYSLEFPAGLLDANESAEIAGIRELKEETGYTASKVHCVTHGKQSMDPGMTDDSINFVVVDVDGDAEVNAVLHQNTDDDERIEVLLVPYEDILGHMKRFTAEGVHVEAIVYSYAIGIAFSQHL